MAIILEKNGLKATAMPALALKQEFNALMNALQTALMQATAILFQYHEKNAMALGTALKENAHGNAMKPVK